MNEYWINLYKEIQAASDCGDAKSMNSLKKTALSSTITQFAKLKSGDGEPIQDQAKQLKRWVEHYSKLKTLNIQIWKRSYALSAYLELNESFLKQRCPVK